MINRKNASLLERLLSEFRIYRNKKEGVTFAIEWNPETNKISIRNFNNISPENLIKVLKTIIKNHE